jgi:hypothetical protein
MGMTDQWGHPENMGYYQPHEMDSYQDPSMYDQNQYTSEQDNGYTMNPGVGSSQGHIAYNHDPGYQMNHTLFKNNSTSSIGNIDNFSHSEESEAMEGFNRTQSVRLYQNQVNTGAMTSRLNSSYESRGVFDDEEARQSSRSYFSSGSRGSNPNYTSTCARTFNSSGGMIEKNNSYQLTPRQMNDYSFESGQFYDQNNLYNSFHGFQGPRSDQYATMS